jgi:serine/threonine-protein kinase HipA
LKKLSPKLTNLKDFPFSAEDQVKEAIARAAKMSIQGVQPKLSVRLDLKNFSIIRRDLKVELSPAYDLLNSTIILNSQEELALSLHGKRKKLKKDDFFVYFAKERLGLTQKSIGQRVSRIVMAFPIWTALIQNCFLSDSMKTQYIVLLNKRFNKLDLTSWG